MSTLNPDASFHTSASTETPVTNMLIRQIDHDKNEQRWFIYAPSNPYVYRGCHDGIPFGNPRTQASIFP